jgi:metallo-beta-lactamase class B
MKQIVAGAIFLLVSLSFSEVHSSDEPSENEKPWLQWGHQYPDWVNPIQPFNIIANIYYVGTEGIASFLITSDDGHVLIDGGLPQSASNIIQSIDTLGFKISDVKILLNSHAHFDHSGGLAEIKKRSGAVLLASRQDKPFLESGLYPGSDNINYSAPKVNVDQEIVDGEMVSLGTIKLTANITPGHSPGCTSWSMTVGEEKAPLNVLFFCSATVAGNRLVNPPQYPGIVEDYRHTFAKTKSWQPDVFLANHSSFFKLKEKRQLQSDGDEMAFVDKVSFPNLIRNLEKKFESAFERQSQASE